MGLIYVNPEGPDGNPDFQLAANDIRETFARMAMNDEETVALIAGGHAFGKAHGAGDAAQVGEAPEGGELHQVGLGWANSQGKGHSEDTISSGLEGAWTPTPIKWDNTYLELIFKYEWEKTHSPAGAVMWHPIDCEKVDMTPDAHIPRQMNLPVMFTTDLALRYDAKYAEISRKFLADFDYFSDQFARAWFKLTHRDMGPRARYHGDEVPAEVLLWQDPVAEGSTEWTKSKEEIATAILATGLSNADLVKAAWRSASTFRNSDKRGGANGARIALEPQRSWAVNADVIPTIEKLAEVKSNLNVDISLADLIVFAGNLAIERAASEAGVKLQVEVSSGRGDSTQDQTDVESFNYLKPIADGFINWSEGNEETAEHLLLEKASLLGLTPPELTVLVGGLRAIGATSSNTQLGVLTSTPGVLNNEFFRNLLDNNIAWAPKSGQKAIYGSHAYADGERKWTATRADLVFASNSVLRAVAEVYAADDANEKFVNDFVAAWTKVMKADLF
jgi:catalase-peroxidase